MKSQFGSLIYEIASLRGLSIAELAQKIPNTTASTFSKIRMGHYAKLSDERIAQIAQVLAPEDVETQAMIVTAYLWDMCPSQYQHTIQISPKLKKKPRVATGAKAPVTLSLNDHLERLAVAAAKEPAFHEHLLTLSSLAETIIHPAPNRQKSKKKEHSPRDGTQN